MKVVGTKTEIYVTVTVSEREFNDIVKDVIDEVIDDKCFIFNYHYLLSHYDNTHSDTLMDIIESNVEIENYDTITVKIIKE